MTRSTEVGDPAAVELEAVKSLTRTAIVSILSAVGLSALALALKVDATVALGVGGISGMLITQAANAVGSIGSRRTRIEPTSTAPQLDPSESPFGLGYNPGTPPPLPGQTAAGDQ